MNVMEKPQVEITVRDLRIARDFDFIHHGKYKRELINLGYTPKLKSVEPPVIVFNTKSSDFEKNRTTYTQKIRLMDFDDIIDQTDIPLSRRVNLLVTSGDVAVKCDCPSFLYFGYAYILTQLDAKHTDPENRPPKIRNPRYRGTVCKHLSTVLEVVPFLLSDITRMLKDQGYE